VFEHAVEYLETEEGYRADLVVQLRPTSPLRPPGLVDRGIELLLSDPAADSVRCVAPSTQNPFKMWRIEDGRLEPLLGGTRSETYNMPRQALPPTFWQTGHVEVIRDRTLREQRSMTGSHILPLLVDPRYAVDIDDLYQWQMAESELSRGASRVVRPLAGDIGPRLAQVRLLALDFDGVLTDGRVQVSQDGQESVTCNRADGMGIGLLRRRGIQTMVISTEANPVVAARCRKLGLRFEQAVADKARLLLEVAADRRLALEEVAFVGNDVNDLECLRIAGVSFVPADAHPEVQHAADLVLGKGGGDGAVREACDRILAAVEHTREVRQCAS
jgi:N-acylneuraminate cytidylyltransferase